MTVEQRLNPNIIICGTPGTGKTSHAQLLCETLPQLRHLSVGDIVKEKECHTGYDQEWETYDVDTDRLLDELDPLLEQGDCVIDWHMCEIFDPELIDLVVVLRTDHSKLWTRLESRSYSLKKIEENNEAEIMQVCLDEAQQSFDAKVVIELESDHAEQMQQNVDRIVGWYRNWKTQQA